MENCTMVNTDLCFEYSSLEADIVSDVHSIRNPKAGSIKAKSIGQTIIDEHCINPGSCCIMTTEPVTC
jgi:hypothetical protein